MLAALQSRRLSRSITRVLGAGIVAGLAASAQGAVYFDGVFNNADWSLTVITNPAGAGSTAQGFQVPAGGNPNEYRRIRHQLLVNSGLPNGHVTSLHMNVNAFYNPSTQGAITSIDYSEDSINFISNTIVPGNGQGSGLAIFQGGRFYVQRNPILVMPFTSFSNWGPNAAPGLVAADLWELDNAGNFISTSNPDFSIAGGTMQLGFWRGNSGNGSYNTDCGIDNWRVEIIPAPGFVGMAAAGGLLAARRRRVR
jgi:hypothetical protein